MANPVAPMLITPKSAHSLPLDMVAEALSISQIKKGKAPTGEPGAVQIALFEPTLKGWLPGASNVILLVPPEIPPEQLAYLRFSEYGDRIRSLVLHTPMHHLFAIERLGFPTRQLEMIPWTVKPPVVWSPDLKRDSNLLVECSFPGAEASFANRAGLQRSAHVKVLTNSDQPEAADFLSRAGLVVIAPNHRESGAGTSSLLAAMAAGAPILAARSWGLEHLLVSEQEGVLYPVGDVGTFRNEATRMLSQPAEATAMGRVAAAKFATTLTPAHYAARLRRIIRHRPDSTAPEFFLIAAHGSAPEAGR